MRTIIAGSRDCLNYAELLKAIDAIDWQPTVVLSGNARGADTLGEQWAKENAIPLEIYPAGWQQYGKKAGLMRNIQMAEKADALIALWDHKSTGTKHMIEEAFRRGLRVHVQKVQPEA